MAEKWFWWLSLLSLFTFVVSLVSLPFLVARIPTDYFSHERRNPGTWTTLPPVLRLIMTGLKNLLGLLLLAGGLIMLFLPGQGLLTMAMGMLLMNYPGKYRLERRIVAIPTVLRGLNWLRSRRGAPPLAVTESGPAVQDK